MLELRRDAAKSAKVENTTRETVSEMRIVYESNEIRKTTTRKMERKRRKR